MQLRAYYGDESPSYFLHDTRSSTMSSPQATLQAVFSDPQLRMRNASPTKDVVLVEDINLDTDYHLTYPELFI